MSDVTQAHLVYQWFDVERRKFAAFVAQAPAALALLDHDMRYLAASREFLDGLRLHEQEVIGCRHDALFPAAAERWRGIHRRCLAGAEEHREAESFARADGGCDWLRWRMRPWTGSNGSIGGVVLFCEVITARIEAEKNQDLLLRLAGRLQAAPGRAAAALQQAADVFRALADDVPALCWMIDGDGGAFWSNRRWREYTGQTSGTPRGWDWQDAIGPQERSEVLAQWGAAAAQGGNFEMTFPLRRADGQLRLFLTRATPVLAADGRVRRWFGIQTDVTGAMERREALRRSEDQFRATAEAFPGLLFVLTGRGENIYVNPGCCSYTGRTPESLLGRQWMEVAHPEDLPRLLAQFASDQSGPSDETECRFRRHDGVWRWHTVRTQPSREVAGAVDRWVGVCLDIHDRYVLEEELRVTNERFQLALKTLPIMLFCQDLELRYSWIYNPAPGRAAHEIIGKRDAELCDRAEDAEMLMSIKREVIRSGVGHRQEIELRSQGRDICYDLQVDPLRGQAGNILGVACAAIDITERKRIEADLQHLTHGLEKRVEKEVVAREAAQLRAAQAERMQALGQLAGGIAHDLNNVLQAVQGGALLIEKRGRDREDIHRLAEMVLEASHRGAAVTRRLLSFARRGDLHAEPIDAAGLLDGLREILAHTLGTDIVVTVTLAANLPPLLADKSQLETVLVNLASNARDAMPDGGALTLAAAAVASGDGCPMPDELAPGRYIRLCVSDTGAGMDAATLGRAMEPFFTTKPVGKGTGLGLAMARGFAGQSSGALVVDSAPGAGTTVSLWLPVADAAARDEILAAAAPDSGTAGEVLLVDDEAMVRDSLAEQLRHTGFIVTTAPDASAALVFLDSGKEFGILVSDLTMPGGMNGIALVRAAQARRPGLPAILLTGYAGDGTELALCELIEGRFALLRKPISGTLLADRIHALLVARGAQGAGVGGSK
jgi:PAS domain S-box-containing protein